MKAYNPEDTVSFTNIDTETFTFGFDGKSYTLDAGETRQFRLFVGQHASKHLADKILQREYEEQAKKSGDKLKAVRARLFVDPRRLDLYRDMLPELKDVIDTLKSGRMELLKEEKPKNVTDEIAVLRKELEELKKAKEPAKEVKEVKVAK